MSEDNTYKSAGVDIEAGEETVYRIKEHVQSTYNENVLANIGSFGGMFAANFKDMAEPVLVSSIDGVGTKVKVAAMSGKYESIGMDIVNHCIDDILVQGASPLFFLDYFATSRLVPSVVEQIIKGMGQACRDAGCALIGGETAEMPGVYLENEFDIAGCIVGVVDKQNVIDGSKVRPGDAVIGIASSGLHTNGYSLVRRLFFEDNDYKVDQYVPELGANLGDVLLAPHKSYLSVVNKVREHCDVHAMAHLTGGGFYSNIPRVLPEDCQVTVERRSWSMPPIFDLIQKTGNIDNLEMHRTFNMGIGMVLIVNRDQAVEAVNIINENNDTAWIIGAVHPGGREVIVL